MKKQLCSILAKLTVIATFSGAIIAFIPFGGLKKTILYTIGIIIIISVLHLIYSFLVANKLNAYIDQKKIGRFKGLWSGNGLTKELQKNFKNANQINIKVTRGTELFDADKSGQIVTYLRELMNKASRENEIRCNFLLIAPCYKLKHVRERHENHKNQYSTPEVFLETWYETLKKLNNIGNGKSNCYFHTEVRFYYGRHSKWRFYIFESNGDKKTVLFSDYDAERNKHGSSLPMYKVLKDDQNIGGFMERYFNEMWDTSLTKEEFKKLVLSGNCAKRFCEECDTLHIGCELEKCTKGLELCNYKKKCEYYVNNMSI